MKAKDILKIPGVKELIAKAYREGVIDGEKSVRGRVN